MFSVCLYVVQSDRSWGDLVDRARRDLSRLQLTNKVEEFQVLRWCDRRGFCSDKQHTSEWQQDRQTCQSGLQHGSYTDEQNKKSPTDNVYPSTEHRSRESTLCFMLREICGEVCTSRYRDLQ